MRRYCHWLVCGVAVLVAVGVLLIALAGPRVGLAWDTTDANCTADQAGFCGPLCCGHCHPTEHRAWSQSAHAVAAADAAFRLHLEQVEPGSCLRCHTTGYDLAAGRYALAGVTCEACHGRYLAGHSAGEMAMLEPGQRCLECHGNLPGDGKPGGHHCGRAGQDCVGCHSVHG